MIVYRSARDLDAGWCVAVLTPVAFARSRPDARTQTWWLAVYRDAAAWRRNGDSMIFAAEGWADAA